MLGSCGLLSVFNLTGLRFLAAILLCLSPHWWGAVEEAAEFQVWFDWSGQEEVRLPGGPARLKGIGRKCLEVYYIYE